MWKILIFITAGTSIGFKNIASKIAYDLRLWLNRQISTNNENMNNQTIAISRNNQKLSENREKSLSREMEKNPDAESTLLDEVWSFDSGDDVIEISLNDCI